MHKVLNVILLLFASLVVNASEYKIAGTVVDAEGNPLPAATVLLFKNDASNHDAGSTTDLDGKFLFENLSEGNYRIEISFMGFKTKKLNTTLSAEKKGARYNKIILQEDVALLSAVEVSAKRSSLQVDIDKKAFIVNESAVTDGMSVTEVLKEIPSVDVDVEGSVSLRNNDNVEIYINGKPSGLTEENKGDILEQIPAGSIERVEIITNPSSKYDAEGSAGIINIVMKTNQAHATYYGSVSAGISYPFGYKPGGNVSASINLTKNKWTTNIGVGYTNRKSLGKGLNERESYKETDTTLLYQKNRMEFDMNTVFARLGTSCQIDSANNIGLSGMFSYGGRNRSQDIVYNKGYRLMANNLFNAHQNRFSLSESEQMMGNATIDYTHTFSPNHTLTASFNFSANNGETDRTLTQTDYDSIWSEIDYLHHEQYQYTHDHNRNFQGQIDYANPLTPTSKLEAGIKLTFQNQFNATNSSIKRVGDSEFSEQAELSNDFELHQNIYALYATYGNKIKKFAVKLGLRGELTDPHWKLNTTGEESSKKPYFDLFPTAFFAYSFTDSDELQLSYTRRVTRPRSYWINPYINVEDSTSIRFGNPDVDPEYANVFEMNYVKTFKKHIFTTSLYYQLRQDIIQRYSWLMDNAMISTFANMSKSHSTGLELILKDSWKVVNLTTSLNFYYYKLKGGDFSITSVYGGNAHDVDVTIKDRQSFSWTAKMAADFSLPKNFTLQLTGNYRSPRALAQGKTLHTYFFNFGMRKPFLQKKLIATLSLQDIFNSRKRRSETWGDDFFQLSENSWSGRTLNFNLTYNFGNMQKKGGKKDQSLGGGSSDEDVFEEF